MNFNSLPPRLQPCLPQNVVQRSWRNVVSRVSSDGNTPSLTCMLELTGSCQRCYSNLGLPSRLRSQELRELLYGQTCAIQNGGQGSGIEVSVCGDYHLCEGVISPHYNVAAPLAPAIETGPLQCPHYLCARKASRQSHQPPPISTSTVSLPTSVGTGSPSSTKAST